MMQEQPKTNSSDAGPVDDGGTPLDQAISSVGGFLSDPKSITPEALQQLQSDLMDLKSVVDGEDSGQEGGNMPPPSGGMAGMIGQMGGR